jgi:heme exporter protein C
MSTPLTKLLGGAALAAIVVLCLLGLVVTPPDQVQGDLVRLIYLHPAMATTMYAAFALTAVASVLYLYPRTRSQFWDLLAGSAAEVGLVFCGLTLVTGSIWGRPTWGVWWTWDARLTSTALLFVLFAGYVALRRVPGDSGSRATRSSIAALIATADIPIVHFSVEWWRTLHQGPTLSLTSATIHGSQLATLLFSFVTFGLTFSWLLVHRFRMERFETQYENQALDIALAERRAEGEIQIREIAGAAQ